LVLFTAPRGGEQVGAFVESYFLDWANLLLRWLHVITAVAWIGASFYFVFLDSNLEPSGAPNQGDGGAGGIWSVHGGGFYNARKWLHSPPGVAGHLHWFYWESYATWISGFLLLSVSYLWHAQAYLVDPGGFAWSTPTLAAASAVGLLLAFWFSYDLICQLGWSERTIGLATAILVVALAYLSTVLFPGRAAFVITGAMMATAMSANVLVWIIPGQRKMVAAMQTGQPMDPKPGQIGKQRSVHNTYFTLPVLVAMLSNHYGFVTQHEHRFLLLLLLMAAGAAIRVYFVQRHAHRHGRAGNPRWIGLLGLGLILAAMVTAAPKGQPSGQVGPNSSSAKVPQPILALAEKHCLSCHGSAVQMKGLRLDSAEAWLKNAANIHQQVVIAKAMPMGNGTGMTDQERLAVKDWFNSLQQAK
jgi:uncharacterized membrane protein